MVKNKQFQLLLTCAYSLLFFNSGHINISVFSTKLLFILIQSLSSFIPISYSASIVLYQVDLIGNTAPKLMHRILETETNPSTITALAFTKGKFFIVSISFTHSVSFIKGRLQ